MNIHILIAIFVTTGLYILASHSSSKFKLSGTAYYGLHIVFGLGVGAVFVWLAGLPILSSGASFAYRYQVGWASESLGYEATLQITYATVKSRLAFRKITTSTFGSIPVLAV